MKTINAQVEDEVQARIAQALVQDRIARAHAATAEMEAYAAGQVAQAVKEKDASTDRLHQAHLQKNVELCEEIVRLKEAISVLTPGATNYNRERLRADKAEEDYRRAVGRGDCR